MTNMALLCQLSVVVKPQNKTGRYFMENVGNSEFPLRKRIIKIIRSQNLVSKVKTVRI